VGNVALVLFLASALAALARSCFEFDSRTRAALWLGISLKITFVGVAAYFFLPQLIYKDASRYFFEISSIAVDPRPWNAFLSQGPWGYDVSNKMGMSYLYGGTAYLFRADPLLSVFALNIFFSSLTALLGVALARFFNGHHRHDLWVLLALSFHPELFYWTNRVLRENLSIFLATLTIYLCTLLFRGRILTASFGLIATLLLTYFTRAQLTLLFPFFCLSTLLVVSLQNFGKHLRAFSIFLVVATILLLNMPHVSQLIRSLRILPPEISAFLNLSPPQAFHEFIRLLQVLPRVLSFAPAAFGSLGVLLIPFSILTFCGALLSIIHQFFGERLNFRYGNAVLISSASFCIGLAVMDLYTEVPFGVRFRTPITPLLLTVAVPSVALFIEQLRARASLSRPS